METVESNSSSGFAPRHPEIPGYRMESTTGTEHVEGFRGFGEPEKLRWRKRSKP